MNAVMAGLHDVAAHYAPFGWFLPVWAGPLVALCAAGVVVSARGTESQRAGIEANGGSHALRPTPALAFAATALAAFVCVYAYLVLYHEDLIGLDYAQLTARRFVNVPIWPDNGRFFPLGLQEYSLMGLFGASAPLYHAFSLLELVVVLICVFRILDPTPAWFRCLVMIFVMTVTSFLYSFFGLVYPERDMVFWLGIWVLCLQSFIRTNSRAAFCGALIAAQFVLYYKETAFILVGGFAGARILLSGWRDVDLLKQKRYARFAKDHAMEIGHLALCVVFLLVYFFVVARHVTASYVGPRAAGVVAAALKGYVQSDLLVDALALALGWRLVSLVAAKRAPDPFWDSLAAGALAYSLAYVKLGMVREYYLAPADFIAVLYLARLAYDVLRSGRRLPVVAAVLFVGWVFQRNVNDAADHILSRKEFVEGNVRVASFLKDYSRSIDRADSDVTLFFPEVGGFQIMEFSAFLRYKGMRLGDGSAQAALNGPTLVVKSPHRYPDDRCHPSQDFRCVYDPAPRPSDLVVFLPGRQVSARELAELRSKAQEVFHFRPAPTVIGTMLRVLVPADRLMDRATDAYVFKY